VRNKFGGFLLKGIAPFWAMPFLQYIADKIFEVV